MAIEELQHGRYKYLKRLGSGGMGEVYLMQDTRVNRLVAIKVLRAERLSTSDDAQSTSSARLFEREARAIAALDHPNILPLYDFGEEDFGEDSMTYMVMPYCADGSLETWLHQRRETPLTAPQVAALIEQAAEGLQYAHEHGVIHLDVKPPNFLLRANRKETLRPTLLLADFGISRNFTTVSSSSHTIRGTPAAMAPEQWSGEPVFASDQYALAVMAYEMLVGRPPFVGSMEQLMYRHFSMQPQPPSSFNPRLPQAVDAVLLRALSKKPEERFPAIAEFASAFSEAACQPAPFSEAHSASYGTLIISPSEAEVGLNRILTLTNGEEVNILIPPGTQDGQVLRFPRAGAHSDTPGVLLVNIAVQRLGTPTPTIPDVQDAETTPSLRRLAEAGHTPGPMPAVSAPAPVSPRPASATPPGYTPVPPPAGQRSSGPVFPTNTVAPGHTPVPPSASPYPAEIAPAGAGFTPPHAHLKPSEHNLPTMLSLGQSGQITVAPPGAARPRGRFGVFALLSVLVVLLVLAGSIFFYASHLLSSSGQPLTPAHIVPTATPTPTPTPVPPGKNIAGKYNGTMQDNNTGQQTLISVHIVEKSGSGALSGTVSFASASPYTLQGIVDQQGNFTFNVAQPAGQLPFVFHGTYTPDASGNYLKGKYCNSSTGSCQSDAGFFTVGPQY